MTTSTGIDQLSALSERSNKLGLDRSIANFGGGNTSAKTREPDHTGREVDVLWVKGSGSDLATIGKSDFTGLRLEDLLLLRSRSTMSDEEMVDYLVRCQLHPAMPRPSIETLLHAFLPYPHVDHTHPDAINVFSCTADGERLARECFGAEMVWIPYTRPGFRLAKQVGEAVSANPTARLVILAKHGLVTWGATSDACLTSTMAVIDQARQFVEERLAGRAAFGGLLVPPLPEERRQEILVEILPVLRGAVSAGGHKILCPDDSAAVLEFVGGRESSALSQIGAACPDHLVHTKMRPLWIDFDPSTDDMTSLSQRIVDGVEGYREEYQRYLTRNQADTSYRHDPNPRVVLVPGVGLVGIGQTVKAARLARDLYHRAIAVMRGAASLDRFVSLDEAESYAIEYWPLELYKLTLASPSGELTGRVALVTGGAGGIGRAVSRRLAEAGALVVVADLDAAGAEEAASELGDSGLPVAMDVTKEAEVAAAYRAATLAFGGVDIVVSNAGLASSAPVEETTLDLWKRNHEVLSQGYFLVAREAFRVLKRQRTGGSIVFVVSKNSLVAGRNASAYSSAKAAELHLARCLAEEGGEAGIRVNVVNPDAVLQGSRIWDSAWRAERARTYGIEPEELEAFYRERTTLKVDILPDDIADAVLFFANDSRSGKSTGNILNVDGGVPAAYPR